ncbi:MAG: cell division protein FtsB [Chromatiales bacterium 21-64-14]|nr:MAG: cell division protein FtsB [Chromatiales bacterium 21-64-14]HQU15123.1 septum formation initiator family protein [Gammaproteobacteria bacterium]
MKAIFGLLVVLLVVLQYRLWVGEGSFAEVAQLRAADRAQRLENHALAERNQALTAEVLDLKHGLAAVEERARTGLGLIGKDETFFQVVGAGGGRPRD